MKDFLAGPEHIFSILESALPDVRKLRTQYPDAVILPSATALPTPSDKRSRRRVRIPVSPLTISARLTRGMVHQVKPHNPHTTSARKSTSPPRTPGGSHAPSTASR